MPLRIVAVLDPRICLDHELGGRRRPVLASPDEPGDLALNPAHSLQTGFSTVILRGSARISHQTEPPRHVHSAWLRLDTPYRIGDAGDAVGDASNSRNPHSTGISDAGVASFLLAIAIWGKGEVRIHSKLATPASLTSMEWALLRFDASLDASLDASPASLEAVEYLCIIRMPPARPNSPVGCPRSADRAVPSCCVGIRLPPGRP
jgi:hypothetical protein